MKLIAITKNVCLIDKDSY